MTGRNGDEGGSAAPQMRQDFRPGHSVHWIQAKKASEVLADAEPGRIVAVTAQQVVVEVDGRRRRYAVADPNGIRELIGRYGAEVIVQESWSILRLRNYLISIGVSTP